MNAERLTDAVTLYNGDALVVLKTLPDCSVNCCVTSPPYYGLRDYGTGRWVGGNAGCDHVKRRLSCAKSATSTLKNDGRRKETTGHSDSEYEAYTMLYPNKCGKCGAVREDQQIGLEETPAEYIARLVAVFAEVRRVLTDDGVCWVNLGQSYAGGGGFCSTAPSTAGSKSGKYGSKGALKAGGVPVMAGANEPFALRNDLSPDELAYVLSELAAHLRQRNEVAVPDIAVAVDPAVAPLAGGEQE